MKKIVSSLLTLVLVVVFCIPVTVKADSIFTLYGCDVANNGINLKLDSTALHVAKTGGDVSMAVVTAHNEVWTATKNVSWIQLSKTTGKAADPMMHITVLGNTDPEAREGVVSFKTEVETYNYHIYQEAGDSSVVTDLNPQLHVDKESVTCESSGESFGVTVSCNARWTARLSDYNCKWIKFVSVEYSDSCDSTRIIKWETTPNTTVRDRTEYIIIACGNIKKSIIK